jgi:hypothetical protein
VEFRPARQLAPLLAAVFVAALAPSVALADANPNNQGHHYHYGWVHHHSPPPAPAPGPSGGGKTTGPKNTIVAVVPAALPPQAPTVLTPVAPVLAPPRDIVTTAQPIAMGRDLWLVAIILAAVVAATITLAVLAVGRGGHYAIRRTLAPVGIRF